MPDGLRPLAVPEHAKGFVDCDVHEHVLSPLDLQPHLALPWRDWVANWPGLYESPFYVHPLLVSAGRQILRRAMTGDREGARGVDVELFRREHLDRYDVEYAVLGSFFYPGVMQGQPEFAVALASAYNDWCAETWLAKDPRLRGSIQVTPQEPEAAVREIDRMGPHPQMVQVMLPLTNVAYGEPRYHPIYAACQRHGLRVGFHQSQWTATPVGQIMRHNIEWHCAYSLAFQVQVMSLVFEGVFERFPDLRCIMVEGGFTWVPHVMWRMDQHWRQLGIEVPWVRRKPSDTIREHFRFGTQPIEDISAKQFMAVLEMMESDELLVFASDYPHWDADEPAQGLPSGLLPELRRKIMRDNALAFYGFPARARV